MASIGLKVDNNSSGVDLASSLAKALMGDPNLELEIAKSRVWADTQREQQNQIRSAAAYNAALTAAARSKTALAEQDRDASIASIPAVTQLTVDSMGQPVEEPNVETQSPPVVVTDPAEAKVAAPPVQEDRAPVVVDPIPIQEDRATRVPFGSPMARLPIQEDRATRVPTPMPTLRIPDQVTGPFTGRPAGPQLPMPPTITAPGPFPARPGGPLPSSAMVDNSVPPPRTWIQQLLSGLTPYEDMERVGPVSTFPARPTPYARQAETPLPIEPLPSPQATAGIRPPPSMLPEAPVSLEQIMPVSPMKTPGMAPPSVVPTAKQVQLQPDTGIKRPYRVNNASLKTPTGIPEPNVVPLGQQGQNQPDTNAPLVAPPSLAAAASAPPEEKPQAAATAGADVASAATGADGGASDTPETVQTKQGHPMPRPLVEAMVRDIMIGDESPEVKMQAVQRLMGTLGLTYNPAFGKDAAETVKIATLAGGGSAPSKDTAALTLTAEADAPGAYAGTGIDAQDQNTIAQVQKLVREGKPVPPELADVYAGAHTRAYGKTTWHRVWDDETNTYYDVPDQQTIPPNTPTPDEVYRRAGVNAATAPTAPSANAPSLTGTGASPETAIAAQAQPATSTGGSSKLPAGAVPVKPSSEKRTKEETDAQAYYLAMKTANDSINSFTDADMPTSVAEDLFTDPVAQKAGKNDLISAYVKGNLNAYFRTKNPKLGPYWQKALDFSTAILRRESGAATRPEDLATVMERYIPTRLDDAPTRAEKTLRRQIVTEGIKNIAFDPEDNDNVRLQKIDAYVNEKMAEAKGIRPPEGAPAVSAGEAPTPQTQEEFDALPAGTEYIDPEDGKRYVK